MVDALREVELLRVRLPLVGAFRTAHNTTAVKEALLVRVRTDSGIVGWGECTAQLTPEYDGETLDGAFLALRDHLLPRAFAGASFDSFDAFAGAPPHRTARAALECALLDARLRADGVSLATWLGATRETVDTGVAVGLFDEIGELQLAVESYLAAGYRRIKCKIEPGHDVAVLDAARALVGVGDGVAIAADANGSYDLAAARRLFAEIDAYGLQCVEQPCAADAGAITAHAALVNEVHTPISLDETITDASVAGAAIAARACDVISIKVGRLGLAGSTRVHDACVGAGIDALVGGMIETGIGRAALLAVAALPGFTMIGDCSASERFFGPDGDITEPFVMHDGKLRVPDGPGLGVEPIAERLDQYTIARERITARDARA